MRVPVYRPLPPFLGWPCQSNFAGGHGWVSPFGPALITQTTMTHVTVEHVHALSDYLDSMDAAGVLKQNPELIVLHDWRSIASIESGCREAYRERYLRRGAAFGNCDIYLALSGNPLLKMMFRTAALGLQMVARQRIIRFVDCPESVLEHHHVVAPHSDCNRDTTARVSSLAQPSPVGLTRAADSPS